MDIQALIKNLHPLEIRVLLSYTPSDELTADLLQKKLDYKEGHANQAFSWLAGKNIIAVVRREPHTFFELTDLGREYAENSVSRRLSLGRNDGNLLSYERVY